MVFSTELGSKQRLLEALADELTARLLEAVEAVADIDLVLPHGASTTMQRPQTLVSSGCSLGTSVRRRRCYGRSTHGARRRQNLVT